MKNKKILTLILMAAVLGGSSAFAVAGDTNAPSISMRILAKSIVLPELKLDNIAFDDALRKLRNMSINYDPAHKGINYVVTPGANAIGKSDSNITLDLKNVTVEEAAKQLARSAGVIVRVQDYALVFELKSENL